MVSVTPDLAKEYQQAIDNEDVPSAEKDLCRRLLSTSAERGIFGFAEAGDSYSGFNHGMLATEAMSKTIQSIKVTERPGKPLAKNLTDSFLVALANGAVIVTNDGGRHFRSAREDGKHVYSFSELVDFDSAPSDVARHLGRLLALQITRGGDDASRE